MAEGDVSQEVEALKADFAQLREDLLALTRSVGELTRAEAEDSVERLKQTANHAAERLRAAAAEANAYKDASLAAAEQQIVDHPISSIVVAFAAGTIFGKLVVRW